MRNTAMKRRALSVPMRWLYEQGRIQGKALDYGCGFGYDAEYMNMAKWDPIHSPDTAPLLDRYHTVTCNYVLNVIPDEDKRLWVLKVIQNLLVPAGPGGNAYISVRRDVRAFSKYQYNVILPLESIRKTSTYEIYRLQANTGLE